MKPNLVLSSAAYQKKSGLCVECGGTWRFSWQYQLTCLQCSL